VARVADDAADSSAAGAAMSTGRAPDTDPAEEPGSVIFGVHAVRADEVQATEALYRDRAAAEAWALGVSGYPDVLAAAVTRYVVDAPGHRTPVSLYVNGQRQQAPYVSDDRRVFANARRR
jgi:hypothetical protein